ncbi:hypothetical protein KAFR_0A06970 [Kazachstania africana CBS 2517]|uniref:Signal recognition particle subunit SRP14 n=1 Tax=Kazachstania africana (strain ATCC 22294 / BCRC 22015 / CBS 2517 / CECT 1963 / NBRC 1671 / NRRL Y-8276) TaxID=1071382 RepID=H2AP32_KAZAF|nr:hypothetical protein KAFR_0A06970 [Kazachstania africana CBS 2517]CCF56132.1 hypothetical protein KAFR_0A06970 [Kazachstania africana CBS 2517]
MANEGSLAPEEFLVKASEFFKIANEKGIAVRLTVKRLVKHDPVLGNAEFDTIDKPHYDVSKVATSVTVQDNLSSQEIYPLLFRITYGSHANKQKCSTVVNPDVLDKFWLDYSSVVKSSMNGLVKKKKSKSKSSKEKKKNV